MNSELAGVYEPNATPLYSHSYKFVDVRIFERFPFHLFLDDRCLGVWNWPNRLWAKMKKGLIYRVRCNFLGATLFLVFWNPLQIPRHFHKTSHILTCTLTFQSSFSFRTQWPELSKILRVRETQLTISPQLLYKFHLIIHHWKGLGHSYNLVYKKLL